MWYLVKAASDGSKCRGKRTGPRTKPCKKEECGMRRRHQPLYRSSNDQGTEGCVCTRRLLSEPNEIKVSLCLDGNQTPAPTQPHHKHLHHGMYIYIKENLNGRPSFTLQPLPEPARLPVSQPPANRCPRSCLENAPVYLGAPPTANAFFSPAPGSRPVCLDPGAGIQRRSHHPGSCCWFLSKPLSSERVRSCKKKVIPISPLRF